MKVFVLSHIRPEPNGRWSGRFLGVYSSQGQAARAAERLGRHQDYRAYPRGFRVDAVELDEDIEQAVFFYTPPHTPPPPGSRN
jgi:hypothetical protein